MDYILKWSLEPFVSSSAPSLTRMCFVGGQMRMQTLVSFVLVVSTTNNLTNMWIIFNITLWKWLGCCSNRTKLEPCYSITYLGFDWLNVRLLYEGSVTVREKMAAVLVWGDYSKSFKTYANSCYEGENMAGARGSSLQLAPKSTMCFLSSSPAWWQFASA